MMNLLGRCPRDHRRLLDREDFSRGDAQLEFDEIDAGIGGSTALAMGRKLADLSRGRQVLVVTHLPQVAAGAAGGTGGCP